MDATHTLLEFPLKAAAPRIHKTQQKTKQNPKPNPAPQIEQQPKMDPRGSKARGQNFNFTEEFIIQEKLAELPLVNPDGPRG